MLAFLIVATSIVFLSNVAAVTAFAGAHTALDLKAILKGISALPSGSYVVADNWKYLTCLGLILLLLGICVVKQYFYETNLDSAYDLLGHGTVGIIGFVIAGMKVNKAATKDVTLRLE